MKNWKKMLAAGLVCATAAAFCQPAEAAYQLNPEVKNATMALKAASEIGVLSTALNRLSTMGISVLTITQSLPIRGKASVAISLDISEMSCTMTELMQKIEHSSGVEQARLVAVE